MSHKDITLEDSTVKNFRHDIKNDVSVILAFTEILKLNPHDAKAPELLEKIEKRARKIIQTVDEYFPKDSED